MSDTTILKCSSTNCVYETRDPNAMATHLSHTRPDGVRWECQGWGCGLKFCTTQAMTEVGGHYDTCAKFIKFRRERKYGRNMILNDRLEMMSRRVPTQLTGLLSDGPVAGFSKAKRDTVQESEGEEHKGFEAKKCTTKPSKCAAPIKPSAASKHQKVTKKYKALWGDEDDEFNPNKDAVRSRKPNNTPKRRPALKREAMDESEEEEDEDDEPSTKKSTRQSRKAQAKSNRKSRATAKRQKTVYEDEEESEGDRNEDDDDAEFDPKYSGGRSRKRGATAKPRAIKRYYELSSKLTSTAQKALASKKDPKTKEGWNAKTNHLARKENDEDDATKEQQGRALDQEGHEDYPVNEGVLVLLEVNEELEQVEYTKLKNRLSAVSHTEANIVPPSYGCTQCSMTHLTVEAVLCHAEQSNSNVGRWECMGCGVAFCNSEKQRLIPHFEMCEPLKNLMMASKIAWPRHTDDDFIALTDRKEKRRSWPARNDARFAKENNGSSTQQAGAPTSRTRYANATAKRFPSAATQAVIQPGVPNAFWYENSWHNVNQVHDIGRDAPRIGAMHRPGTSTAIFEHPPAVGIARDGHDGDWVYALSLGEDDETTMFGVSNAQAWGAAEQALDPA